jgi:CHAD domain-containing protein
MADRSPQALTSPGQPVQQCREIFLRQLGGAVHELAGSKPNIHGARKQLKRARATLRLLRPAVGDELYRRENIAARDAARPLSKARDEEVLSQALEGLVDRFGPLASGLDLRRNAREMPAKQLDDIKAALERSTTRARAWELAADADWDCIEHGLHSTYRRARHALRRGRKGRATEDLHEWRKQTKYLWHQLQLLVPLAPGTIGEQADEFHRLSDYLGDEHDLAVLRGRVSGKVTDLVDRRREELQDKAFALGERLYADKSKTFVHRLQKQWADWERKKGPRHLTAISAP